MRARFVALLSTTLLGLLVGTACRPKYDPNQEVKAAPEGCCKYANETMTQFAGCRLTHRCKEDEPIWLRGAVSCTAEEPDRCGGARCCKLQPLYGSPDGVLNWDGDTKKAPDTKKPDAATPPAETPPPAETLPPAETPSEPAPAPGT